MRLSKVLSTIFYMTCMQEALSLAPNRAGFSGSQNLGASTSNTTLVWSAAPCHFCRVALLGSRQMQTHLGNKNAALPSRTTEATSHTEAVQNNPCSNQLLCDQTMECSSKEDWSAKIGASVSLSWVSGLKAWFNTSCKQHEYTLHLSTLCNRKMDFSMSQCFQNMDVLASTALCCASHNKIPAIMLLFSFLERSKQEFLYSKLLSCLVRQKMHSKIFTDLFQAQEGSRITASTKKNMMWQNKTH